MPYVSLVLLGFQHPFLDSIFVDLRQMKPLRPLQLSSRALLLAAFLAAAASSDAELIPAERLPPGGKFVAGVSGGIPNINDMFCDVTVSIPGSALLAVPNDGLDDSPAIQAALDLCPDGQFVYVPAGTYRIETTLTLSRNGVVLRGAGMGVTKLEAEGDPTGIRVDGPVNYRGKLSNVTGGYTRGSTTLTFASASDLNGVAVGDMIIVYDLATTTDFVTVGGRLERRTHRSSAYQWTESSTNSGEFYLEAAGGGAPSFPFPLDQLILRDAGDEVLLPRTSSFPVPTGQWNFGNNDSLGFNTIYVRLAANADPDTLQEDGLMSYRNINYGGLNHASGYANYGQGFKIAGVSGNTLTLDRPFYWTWDNTAGSLEIRRYNQFGERIGVEDLTLTVFPSVPHGDPAEAGLSARTALAFEDATNSWVKGVEVTLTTQNFIVAKRTIDCTFHGNYVHTGRNRQGGSSYGIRMQDTNFNNLIENNRAYELRHSFVADGMNAGHVFAYNFSLDPNDDSNFLYQDYLTHGSHPMYILWEGNIGARGYADFVHGSASHMVYYRNYFRLSQNARRGTSIGPAGTQAYPDFKGAEVIDFDRWNTNMSVIGNVLGYPAWTDADGTPYPKFSSVTGVGGAKYEGSAVTIFRIGYDADTTAPSPVDLTPAATLYRRDNYDYANESIFDAVNTAELVDSLYLDSKPYFFGVLPFPAVDPTNPSAATGTANPAAYTFENGVRPNTIPLFLDQPDSSTMLAGTTATFKVRTDGVPVPTYQWKKNGVDLVNGGDISGATSASLTIANLEDADDGSYTVVATNVVGAVTSSASTLEVNPPAVITTQPLSDEVTQGANVSFTVTAEGASPITYQWKKDGVDLSGQTNSFLALNAVTPANAGNYTVVATNAFGSDTSSTATLVVNVPPAFSVSPANQTITSGDDVAFTVTVSGSPTPTLQWRKDGVDLSGETSSTLSLTSVLTAGAGGYTVVATNVAGVVTSGTGTLAVNKRTQAITFNTLASKTFLDPAFSLSATASSGLPVSFASSDPAVASISGSTVTVVGAGSATLTASQAGNSEYLPAPDVGRILAVNKAGQTISFNALIARTFGDANFNLASTASSGLPVSFASSDLDVVTISGNIVAIVGAGSVTITANQTGNPNYNAATSVPQPLTVNKASQSITFGTIAAHRYGDTAFNLDANASSGLAVSYASSDPTVATVSGNIVTVIGIGSTTLTASQTGNSNYAAADDVPQTLTVNKADQTITFGALASLTFGDASLALTGTSTSGLTVSYTSSNPAVATVSGNTVNIVGTGSTTLTAAQTGNSNYNAAVVVPQTLTVDKADQTVTFGALSNRTFGDAAFNLGATASSGLTVAYASSNTAVATISGNTLTIVGAGNATITASQTGNVNFNAATSVLQSLSVSKANQTITFGTLSPRTTVDAPFDLTATASSDLAIAYTSSNPAVATVSGIGLTIVGEGTTVITASQPGNGDFNAATSVPQSLTVSKANQTITFGTLAARATVDAPFELTASASSGLPVAYTSSNPAVATISGNVVTVVGAGTTTVTATQAGDTNYQPATPIPQSLTVNRADQTISFSTLGTHTFGDPTFSLNATASSGLAVTFSSSNPAVATVSGDKVTIVGAGSTTFTATQGGNDRYLAAPDATQILIVNKEAQTISFDSLPAQLVGAPPFDLAATASSGLAVSYTSSNPSVATVNGSKVTLLGQGTTTITALQAGNANVEAASSVARSLVVGKADQTISFPSPGSKSLSSAPFTLNASASSGLPVSYSSSNSSVATLSGNTVTIVGVGSTVITASQAGNDAFGPAASVTRTLVVEDKAAQTITFPALPALTIGDSAFDPGATASSGLPVSYTSSDNNVATVSGSTVTLVGTGTTAITASQSGNADFLAAAEVTRSFVVNGPPSFILQPSSATTGEGTSVTFSTVVTGSPTPTLQWFKDNKIITGATAANLSLTNLVSSNAGVYTVVASNSAGSVTSNPAVLAIIINVYAGQYFGSFENGDEWALHIRDDNTGTFIAYLTSRASVIVVEFTVSADGTFTVGGTEYTATTTGSSSGRSLAHDQATITLIGSISGGTLTGSIRELGLALSGSSASGSNALAGLYSIDGQNPEDGGALLVVGRSGKTLMVTVSPTSVDGATGALTGSGALSTTTAGGDALALEINTTSRQVSARLTPPSSTTPRTYSGLSDAVIPVAKLANLSVRSEAGSDNNSLIAGFVVSGSSKSLLIRGVGPTLGQFGVPGTMPDPSLTLYRASSMIAANDNWGDSENVADITSNASRLGAFPLAPGSADAVLYTSLSASPYTAKISAATDSSGIALVEVYDGDTAGIARLTNLSVRSAVGTDAKILVLGFVITGNSPLQLLIRGVGPSLAAFGIGEALANPQLKVWNSTPQIVASNDDWNGTTELLNAFSHTGAFTLTSTDSADAALLVNLPPGLYTVELSGVGGTTGVALAEIYLVP